MVEDRSTNRFPVGDSLCHARDKMKSVCFKLTFQLIYKEKSALRCQIYQSTAGIGQAALSLKKKFSNDHVKIIFELKSVIFLPLVPVVQY